MTDQQPNFDRLDRLENLAGSILTALNQLWLRQEVTQQQVDSNARAIESSSSAIADLTHQVDELRGVS